MKRTSIILSLAAVIFLVSCDKKSSGTEFDFSNSLTPYVTLRNTDTVDALEGDSVSLSVGMRTAFQQNVTVYYNVSAPVNLTDQTIVIGRNLLRAAGKFKIGEGIVTDPSGSENADVILTKAVTDDGTLLTLGRYNDPSSQTLDVVISKP
ncbi:MAG: hypothetical protein H0X41_03790 [Chitinophagaceae bacterium]|nr:hypothetical protein [Chitinophagaceae bacterium]